MTQAVLFLGAPVAVVWLIWLLDWFARRRDRQSGHGHAERRPFREVPVRHEPARLWREPFEHHRLNPLNHLNPLNRLIYSG